MKKPLPPFLSVFGKIRYIGKMKVIEVFLELVETIFGFLAEQSRSIILLLAAFYFGGVFVILRIENYFNWALDKMSVFFGSAIIIFILLCISLGVLEKPFGKFALQIITILRVKEEKKDNAEGFIGFLFMVLMIFFFAFLFGKTYKFLFGFFRLQV